MILLSACGNQSQNHTSGTDSFGKGELLTDTLKTRQSIPGGNSRNSIDWEGTYTGVLPCADCEGIETVIKLSKDLTYSMTSKYIGKSSKTFEGKGSFSWSKEGNKIKLGNITDGQLLLYRAKMAPLARFEVSEN